jgi:fission process protein 1
VITDVALETMREKERGSDPEVIKRIAIKRALFQTTASMLLPALTIHQTVHLASAIMNKFGGKNKWIPTIAGLAMIPALPFMFDHPMEHVIDTAFDRYWPVKGSHPGHSTHNPPDQKEL